MTTCANEGCTNEVTVGYKFCGDCYRKWTEKNRPTGGTKQWDDDKIVSVLLQINANAGNMLRALERIATTLEQQGQLALAVAKEANPVVRKPRKTSPDLVPEEARHG